jgi:hypothetical protein
VLKCRVKFVVITISVYLIINCLFCEQAAMHGLPVIATKNGAPVEIHQVSASHFPICFFLSKSFSHLLN